MKLWNLKAQPHALRVFQDFQVFQKPQRGQAFTA